MSLFIVLFVLSWIVVAFGGALVVTTFHIVFGSLPYAEGKYALVVAALGVVATIEAVGFNLRRELTALVAVLASLALTAISPAHADPFMRMGDRVLPPMAFTVFCQKYPRDCEPDAKPNERVVLVPGGEGHLVLVVPTDRGDFVLDNLRSSIIRWDTLPYQWLKTMSPENPLFWRRIQSIAPVHSGALLYLSRSPCHEALTPAIPTTIPAG